jgi:hypothetical protein
MLELSNEFLLDRRAVRENVQQHLSPGIELLEELVNYGTNLIVRCLHGSSREMVDLVAVGILLKHAVGMLDSIHVLLKEGCVLAAHLPLRSMFEASLHLDFLLREESDQRALVYYTAHLRKQRLWARRLRPGTPEAGAFLPGVQWRSTESESADSTALAEKMERAIDQILSSPEYAATDNLFVARKPGSRDREWYMVLGVPHIREMASRLGRSVEYELIYGPGSDVTHADVFASHVRVGEGQTSLTQLRSLRGYRALMQSVVPAAIGTYQRTLEHYRSEEVPRFAAKYVTEWRGRFQAIPAIDENPVVHVI